MKIINTGFGINENTIRQISKLKNEPEWMLNFRLNGYHDFEKLGIPKWGPNLSFLDFDKFIYYSKYDTTKQKKWEDLPANIRDTFEKLHVNQEEAKYLNGLETQLDSEMVYSQVFKETSLKNVIYTDLDSAVKKYPELVQKYLGKLIYSKEHKFAALNAAVWSGGTFIYVPKDTTVNLPLHTYFRINNKNVGQFERTLIIVDDNSSLQYIEGCTAPIYSEDNLHAACVEVYVGKNAKMQYTTVQNWSDNVLNLVTKRAKVDAYGYMSWIDGNLGSRINMKYPCTILSGEYASAECVSIAVSHSNIEQDTGAKMIHTAPHTRSTIISKTIASGNGIANYRGWVEIKKDAFNSYAHVKCDSLFLNEESKGLTYPYESIQNSTSSVEHEAYISKLNQENMFYLTSLGIDHDTAKNLMLVGFIAPFSNKLPLEYSIELNRLLELNIDKDDD